MDISNAFEKKGEKEKSNYGEGCGFASIMASFGLAKNF